MRSKNRNDEANSFYEAYADGSRNLRAWFVAYGIGGPVLFLTQEGANRKIANSGHGKMIVILFLIGVLLQIIIAAINKWANWYIYAYTDSKPEDRPRAFHAATWISDKFCIDVFCDLGSLVTFAWATVQALMVFV